MPESDPNAVIPAQLSFLAIYNPSLGPTDETIEDQIAFYTSRAELQKQNEATGVEQGEHKLSEDERNERLRQVGLAQGMVNFASNFSSGKTLEYVETDKTRVVLLELEKDWWIVASIDLTRLPASSNQTSSTENAGSPVFQYSSREMGPPQLFIQQLRRAHSIFLLLHDFSLDGLYTRVGRSSFCLFLERFWRKFAWDWEILLTGNPIVEIYNGIKLAAGGELGIGVGEEEWGSGEREVLEGFVSRTDCLRDLVVSRFGGSEQAEMSPGSETTGENKWIGSENDPQPSDGIIFSGLGSISRSSLSHISHWMEWVFKHGDSAYGIGRDPTSLRRRKPRKSRGRQSAKAGTCPGDESAHPSTPDRSHTPGIPRPLVIAGLQTERESQQADATKQGDGASPPRHDVKTDQSVLGTETVMKYLTLGYGSSWSFSPKSSSASPPGDSKKTATSVDNDSGTSKAEQGLTGGAESLPAVGSPPVRQHGPSQHALGRFILGPRDDLEKLDDFDEGSPEPITNNERPKTRIVHRTLHVQLADASGSCSKLQAVIYVHQPFMFTFLFEPNTPSLSSASLYSSIHHQLGPLQKSLLASTSPTTAAARISQSETSADAEKRSSLRAQSVYDIVYDPSNLTIRSSIPNIPGLNPASNTREPSSSPPTHSPSPSQPPNAPLSSRVESLTIHQRLLTTYIDTRSRLQELERTYKTSRGWWIVWIRIPQNTTPSHIGPPLSTKSSSAALSSLTDEHASTELASPPPSKPESEPQPQEAFIVCKASDYTPAASHGRMSNVTRFLRDLGGASSSLGSARAPEISPSKLVEGLGMDARRYVEGLLDLNR